MQSSAPSCTGHLHLSGQRVYHARVTKELTVLASRSIDSVFCLLHLATEPRTGGAATGVQDYVVVGIEDLDC